MRETFKSHNMGVGFGLLKIADMADMQQVKHLIGMYMPFL